MPGGTRGHARKSYALIAEVDPSRAANYVALVTQLGLEPNHVRDGEAGRIAMRTRGAPALVVTELALPRSDGFALIADLRQRCPPEETPVVVISAYLELRSRAWAQRETLGIAEVIAPSSSQEQIMAAMRRALSQKQMTTTVSLPPPADAALPAIAEINTALFVGDDAAQGELAQEIARAFDVPFAVVQTAGALFIGGAQPEALGNADAIEELLLHRDSAELLPDLLIDRARMEHPLVKRGAVRSAVIVPVVGVTGRVGAVALFHGRRGAFTADHLQALQTLARRLASEQAMRSFDDSASAEIMLSPRSDGPSHAALLALVEGLDDGVVLVDGDRRVVFANRVAASLLMAAPEQLVGLPFADLIERNKLLFDDPALYRHLFADLVREPRALQGELEVQRPQRRILRWTVKPLAGHDGAHGAGELMTLADVTAQADLFAAREALVRTDSLTSLPNRTAAEETIAREVARARRDAVPVALALVDLDRFGDLNRRHGGDAGDEVLRRVALMLEATLRGGDFVGRWAGDEFVLLLSGVTRDGAVIAAERVRRGVAELALGGVGGQTVSIGVAAIDVEQPPELALTRAAEQLGDARTRGGNRVCAAR